jgi:hypothetical protein
MVSAAIVKVLWMFGIAILISMGVALLIKLLVGFTARIERSAIFATAAPVTTVCPVGPGISDDDVAAVSAAIFAMIGPHRVVHIGEAGHGHSWMAEGRAALHTSHAVDRRSKH